MKSEVSAVIGNYRGATILRDCLESLHGQTTPPAETIVVDADGSAAGIAERILPVDNRGLAVSYNRGAAEASTTYVLFLNNDVALERECIGELVRALDGDPARFAADPQQLDWERNTTIHARTTLTRGKLVREFIPGFHLEHRVPAADVIPTICANGAAMLVRREMFARLGGFDDTFFMEWEDLDLCWRAWLRGWPTVYVPQARLRHRVGAATGASDQSRRAASSHHNILRFALKCLPASAAARVVAGELLRLPRHPRAIASAFPRVAAELPEIRRERRRLEQRRELFDWMIAGQMA